MSVHDNPLRNVGEPTHSNGCRCDPFWTDLKKIAHDRHVTLSELVTEIDGTREQSNLSSAIRVFVLHHFRDDKRMEVAEGDLSAVAAVGT